MEIQKQQPFPDLKDGIYSVRGGYLIVDGNTVRTLRHDNDRNNLEHLHKVYQMRGKLPDIYLPFVRLPAEEPSVVVQQKRSTRDDLLETF